MNWIGYRVVFRLHSPLHIGWRKVGNVQVTRPYLTGRSFWGALTERLVRDRAATATQMATDSNGYQEVGKQVNEMLAFTYFYPALQSDNDYQVVWTWDDERTFRRRFLSSYQSTALVYPAHSAAEGSLHEIEFLSPHTLDAADPVYLVGYVFAHKDCSLQLCDALKRLQFGGERGYGWGKVELVSLRNADGAFSYTVDCGGHRPVITVPKGERLLAHTQPDQAMIAGEVEPLVGREWHNNSGAGASITHFGVVYAPGGIATNESRFTVASFGLWQKQS
ncbi:hypothetical protein [Roseiflexus sp.]